MEKTIEQLSKDWGSIRESGKRIAAMVRDIRHSTPRFKDMMFKPFSEEDWECYAGCESESPMIGEAVLFTTYNIYDIVIIIDDKTVEMDLIDRYDDEKVFVYLKEFEKREDLLVWMLFLPYKLHPKHLEGFVCCDDLGSVRTAEPFVYENKS